MPKHLLSELECTRAACQTPNGASSPPARPLHPANRDPCPPWDRTRSVSASGSPCLDMEDKDPDTLQADLDPDSDPATAAQVEPQVQDCPLCLVY